MRRIAAMQLNAAPSITQRSREHSTKTKEYDKRVKLLSAKLARLKNAREHCRHLNTIRKAAQRVERCQHDLTELQLRGYL